LLAPSSIDEPVQLIQHEHNNGHYGVRTVVERIYNQLGCWWPNMRHDVEQQLKTCTTCQKYDVIKRGYHPPQSPLATVPGDWWQIDLVAMPTSVNGYSYILVILDLFTSFVITRTLKTKSAAETAARVYEVLMEWGIPRIVQSDSGGEFVNEVFEELMKLNGTKLKFSTPGYKHSTGSVERVNRTIATSLRRMLNGALASWDTILPLVTHFYNNTTRSLRGGDRGQRRPLRQRLAFAERLRKPAVVETTQAKRRKAAKAFEANHHIIRDKLTAGTKVLITVKEVAPTGLYILQDGLGDELHRARSQIKLYHDDRKEEQSFQVERISQNSWLNVTDFDDIDPFNARTPALGLF